MPCMIRGTPASTKTLPMVKPGGPCTAFFTSSPPTGTRAIRRRAAFSSMPGRALRSAMISGCS